MDKKSLIIDHTDLALRDLYDKKDDIGISHLVRGVQKSLMVSVGDWAFLLDYIPDDLRGDDALSPEEKAMIRALQLYALHISITTIGDPYIDDGVPILKALLQELPEERPDLKKRLGNLVTFTDADAFADEVVYFIKVLKGRFKLDYARLAYDMYLSEIDADLLRMDMIQKAGM